jgi:hypothetical protein
MFLMGSALITREILAKSPDPMILEIGASLTGIPAWLHRRHITRTERTPSPSVGSDSSPEPVLPSGSSSESDM